MGEFERGFLIVMAICGVLMVLGYKGWDGSRQTTPVRR